MIKETGLTCVVSGSFSKFKPEIDLTIEEFRELGVKVLAPQTGWLYIPPSIITPRDRLFRQLPSEKYMDVRQIEDSFLGSLAIARFHYIENPEGYIGSSTAMEIGFAYARGVISFMRFATSTLIDPDPLWREIISKIKILSPQQVVDSLVQG